MHKIKVAILTLTVLLMLVLGTSIASAAHKVLVNHVDVTTGTTKQLCVGAPALQAHLNHGDAIVDVDGDLVADSCSP